MKKQNNKQAKRASKLAKAENLKKKQQDLAAKIITVKNAEGDADTTAEIVVQNQITYTPKVSVIIPVYNVEAYLRQCLDSVVGQTLKEIEIICVDDGSTDKSLDILLEYAAKDNRITVMKQENLHAGVARNAGLAVAKGEYVHFLDSDDWVDVDTYEKLYKIIEDKKVPVLKFRSYTFDNKKSCIVNSYFTNMGAIANDFFNTYLSFDKDYNILIDVSDAPWSGIYLRKFIIDNVILFDNLLCANDTSFFYRCLVNADRVFLTEERFVYYRINNSSSLIGIRAYNFDCQIKQFFIIKKIIRNLHKTIITEVRKHLIHSAFYRYTGYLNNPLLTDEDKNKIRNEMKYLIEHIDEIEVDNEYLGYYKDLQFHTQISIIIPVYNAEKYLGECLESVINQTLKNIEIICVNDGSTDNSLKILQEYAKKDKRIIILEQKNSGSAAARNYALSKARGEYVGFIDSDDYIDSNYYSSLLTSALSNCADISATSECRLFKGTEIISRKGLGLEEKKIYESIEDKGHIIITTGVSCNKIYRKDFIIRNKIHCLELKNAAEDNYFTDTSIICANKISVVNDVVYFYRITEGSQTQVSKNNKQFYMTSVYKAVDDFIFSLKISKEDKEKWLEIINKRKVRDFGYFYNTMADEYKEDFRKHFLTVFPNLTTYINTTIISLTSYPARINTVNQTIETLLNQSMKADKVILWLAPEQFPHKEKDLPPQLLDLCDKGLTIDWYHDIKSYKKLIPTLKKYPDAVIITADDDALYDTNWLIKLYKSYLSEPHMIHCHRAHKITIKKGKVQPYRSWIWYNKLNNLAAYSVFFTGLGGVLYPPHSLSQLIFDEDKFTKLCPHGDDIWFWAMAVLNGYKIKLIENAVKTPSLVAGTQESALWLENVNNNKNDEQLANVFNEYPQILKLLKEGHRKEIIEKNIKSYLLFPYYWLRLLDLRDEYATAQLEAMQKSLRQMRIDIKNFGTTDNTVAITAPQANVAQPTWFANAQGIGSVIQTSNAAQKISLQIIKDGKLRFDFRGADKRDASGVRFPVWIDYKSIKIDGKELISAPVAAWHDKPYRYEMPVKDGQLLTVEIEQQPHRYTAEELSALLLKLNPNSPYIHSHLAEIVKLLNYQEPKTQPKPHKSLGHFLYHKIKTDSYTKTYICGIRVKKKPANIYSFIDNRLAQMAQVQQQKIQTVSQQLQTLQSAVQNRQQQMQTLQSALQNQFNLLITQMNSALEAQTKEFAAKINAQNAALNNQESLLIGQSHLLQAKLALLTDNLLQNFTQSSENYQNKLIAQIKDMQTFLEQNASRNKTQIIDDIKNLIEALEKTCQERSRELTSLNTSVIQQTATINNLQKNTDEVLKTQNLLQNQLKTIQDAETETMEGSKKCLEETIRSLSSWIGDENNAIKDILQQQNVAYLENITSLSAQTKIANDDITQRIVAQDKTLSDFRAKNQANYQELNYADLLHDSIISCNWLKDKSFSLFGWAANYSFIYILYRILDKVNPTNILEMGLGQTTKLTSQYAAYKNRQAQLHVCEHNQDWIDIYTPDLPQTDNIKINHFELENFEYEGKINDKYAKLLQFVGNTRYDLIVVDGPVGGGKNMPRSNILDLIKNNNLADDFIIIFDDAERMGEKTTIAKAKELLQKQNIEYSSFERNGIKCQHIITAKSREFVKYL